MCLKRGWRRQEDESHMGSSLSNAVSQSALFFFFFFFFRKGDLYFSLFHFIHLYGVLPRAMRRCSSRDGVAAPLCNQMSRTLDGYKRLPLTRTSHPTTMDRGIREWTKLVQLDQPYQQEPPRAQARDLGKSKTKKQNEKPKKKEKASKKRTYPASSAGPTMTKEVQNILDSSCFYCLYLLFPLAKGARKYLYLVAIYIDPDRLLPKTALYTVNAASWLGLSCL